MHYNISTESTIRHLAEGLLEGKESQFGLYIGFDLRVSTNPKMYEQRDVAVGVHFLRFHGRVIGAANRDFLGGSCDKDYDWESVSTHSSCWADSFRGYIDDIVNDIMKNQKKSKYTKEYKDDGLIYADDYSSHLSIQTVKLVPAKDLMEIKYKDRHNADRNGKCPTEKLISEWAYKFLGLTAKA